MGTGDGETAGGRNPAVQRVLRFVALGAAVGVVVFVLKVALADDFAFEDNWEWAVLIVLGAFAGAALGLVTAGVGQPPPD